MERFLGFRTPLGALGVVILLTLILSSCSVKTSYKEKGRVYNGKCPEYAKVWVHYCPTKYAYTDRYQHLSKVKIVNPRNGKSVKISLRLNKKVRGICLPKRLKKYLGKPFLGKVYLLRCGENGVKKCPKYIRGYASWYGGKFHGRKTASGIRFNQHEYYAAHRYLPFGTLLEVKNLKNGRKVIVKVVDRGPYVRGRHLDLSYAAAKKLGMIRDGVIPFEAKVLRCGY
ncbi:septal ring lytic transglycosylase RlpA family protein [Aquifex aeolicus]|uniref:Probable endolytic peptidoglycan transglycosylase RlpA n=1 Tax=Aquifex aeolicus (strain VF5) TaxID=224324 RepID=RLPA_AQUAE|nr:septal ring lytic transglycosylase RlpA family protein [Aquifex aeolicus]O67235.1 RecName: Full=Probable endolytic peptidoglycan transglycosylase RlpA; Flags: Precursor [Aquifex aeolicus VF5]AAC07192.1 rare lipoprotein A [Aquifex aeolicus VF5]